MRRQLGLHLLHLGERDLLTPRATCTEPRRNAGTCPIRSTINARNASSSAAVIDE